MCQVISISDAYREARTTSQAETVECLEVLLEAAKRGEVIGVAYAAMQPKRQYTLHFTGEAERNPTFAAGMVSNLLHDLHLKARGEA